MATFPVLDSILATETLAFFLRERYDLNPNTTCRVLRTGINHTYLVSNEGQKYVFRVYSYDWRTSTEILEELKLLNLLKENHVAVSYPLPDAAKEYIQEIDAPEGQRYGVLFSYAAGDKVRNLTERHCHRIGQWMGQFHQLSIDRKINRIEYNAKSLTQQPYQYARKHFSISSEEMQFVRKASEHVTSTFQAQDASALRYGVVHLDLWYDNMNIDANSRITVFDFDFCGNGWLLLDIAYWSMQLFHVESEKTVFDSKLRSFYRGYEGIAPIHDEERALLPVAGLAIWLFYLGVQSQRFDNWSNIFLTKNYLKHYLGLAASWLTYHNVEIN